MNRWISVTFIFLALLGISSQTATANFILDGGFEQQAVLQNNPHYSFGPNGEKWGAAYGSPVSTANSWQNNFNGAWSGGAIARTEDYTTGWKWAKSGEVFGIIKDRQTMSQSFTATASGIGTLSWYDANRAAWRQEHWFGRPNDYSVTLTDSLGNIQTLGNFTSEVAGGSGNWWTDYGKSTWFDRSVTGFNLQAGMNYTLSFNSLSPILSNGSVDDRTTFLDDITLTAVPEPSTLGLLSIGTLGGVFWRRRRQNG